MKIPFLILTFLRFLLSCEQVCNKISSREFYYCGYWKASLMFITGQENVKTTERRGPGQGVSVLSWQN